MTVSCKKDRPDNFPHLKRDLLQFFKNQYLERVGAQIVYFSIHNVVNEFLLSRGESANSDLIPRLQGALSYELRSYFKNGTIKRYTQHTFSINLHTFPSQNFTELVCNNKGDREIKRGSDLEKTDTRKVRFPVI